MLDFLTANAATLCVGGAVLAVSARIALGLYRSRKAGGCSCGCSGCSGCCPSRARSPQDRPE